MRPYCAVVKKSGSLNFLEPLWVGLHGSVMGELSSLQVELATVGEEM